MAEPKTDGLSASAPNPDVGFAAKEAKREFAKADAEVCGSLDGEVGVSF